MGQGELHHKEDAEILLWTGEAWLLRAGLMACDDNEGGAFVAELYVAIPLLERPSSSTSRWGGTWAS